MKEREYNHILVPVDFSRASGRAINTARELGKRSGAAIHLVHVHEYYYPVDFMMPGGPVPAAVITFREDEKRIRKQLGDLARKFGIPTTNCYVRNDPPVFNGVCKVARQVQADLIVLQTHKRTGFSRLFEGSHAERIVQHSPCPVLVARKQRRIGGSPTGRIDRILVPVDFSPCSFAALEYAIQFAEKAAARLVIFHALYLGYTYTADGFAMADCSVLLDRAQKDAEKEMQKFLHLAKFRGVKFEAVVKRVPPGPDICEFAERRDVDLIITATHGRTGLKHLLIGSVAEQIVRHARQSVLIVPSHPETRIARLTHEIRRDQRSLAKAVTKRTRPRSAGGLTKRNRKLLQHAFPERRGINKFRESHIRHEI